MILVCHSYLQHRPGCDRRTRLVTDAWIHRAMMTSLPLPASCISAFSTVPFVLPFVSFPQKFHSPLCCQKYSPCMLWYDLRNHTAKQLGLYLTDQRFFFSSGCVREAVCLFFSLTPWQPLLCQLQIQRINECRGAVGLSSLTQHSLPKLCCLAAYWKWGLREPQPRQSHGTGRKMWLGGRGGERGERREKVKIGGRRGFVVDKN